MYEGCDYYKESTARTNKLWCSDCGKRIAKNEAVIFWLDTSSGRDRMKEVYCSTCKENYVVEAVADTQHPHDLDG